MKAITTGIGMLLTMFAIGCSSAYYQAGGYAGDDLYGIHNKTAIAQREKAQAEAEKAEAEARRAKWEALIAQAQADDAENRYYGSAGSGDLVADTYESAYARRLRGFQSPTYKMPSSYWNLRYSGTFSYLTAYDPAFYNIIVMGDEVWVEPKYITSMFGTWGLATGFTAGYMAGLYSNWYYDWGYGWPYYGWGYRPYWAWNGWYSPWWNHSYWYGGYYPHWGVAHHWGIHGGPAFRPRPNYRLNGGSAIPRNQPNYGTPSRNRNYGNSGSGSRSTGYNANRNSGTVYYNNGGRSNGSSSVYRSNTGTGTSTNNNTYNRENTATYRNNSSNSYNSGSRSTGSSYNSSGGSRSGGGSSSSGSSRGFRGR